MFSRPEQFTALDNFLRFTLNWNTYLVEHTIVNVKTCPLTEHQTILQNIAWKRRLPRTKHGYMWSSSTQTSVQKDSKNPGWTGYNHSSRGYERRRRHTRVVSSALDPIGLKHLDTLWSLHKIVFFTASPQHLDEISKFLDISTQEMFTKSKSFQFLKKKFRRARVRNEPRA